MSSIGDVVFTPAQVAAIGAEHVRQMQKQKHRTMPLLMREIGSYLKPLLPGEICAVQAQTSNYKSGFINFWEKTLAMHLKGQKRDEIIIHVDVETMLETLALQEISQGGGYQYSSLYSDDIKDWGRIIHAADSIVDVPIYRIGYSLGYDQEEMPELTLSNIYRAIKYITEGELIGKQLAPACIFVDYLQALPIDQEIRKEKFNDQRRLQVRQDVYRLRKMAGYFKCPVIVGVQAKQSMTGHGGVNMRIPGTYDGEETSTIAQRFDRIVSLWMPKTTHTAGDILEHNNMSFVVDENLLFVKVNKQRGPLPAGRAWKCEIDYTTNYISVV